MAIDFSNDYLKKSRQSLRFAPLRMIMKYAKFIDQYRQWQRKFFGHKVHPSQFECLINNAIELGGGHFQKNGWVFVENILDKDFHQELVKNWPKNYFFDPPKKFTKSYNVGFRWVNGEKDYPKYFVQYPTLLKFINYLRSDEFCRRVDQLVGRQVEFTCYSFSLNSTYPHSEVIPHKDGIYQDDKAKNFINMVFFINGRGGKNSGGLTLAWDNELKNIIIEPENLVNSCLIYDSKANFFHGFKQIDRGKFRWAVNSQFCEKTYLN